MTLDITEIVQTYNKIQDELWVTDFNEAFKLTEQILEDEKVHELISESITAKDLLQNIRNKVRNLNIKKSEKYDKIQKGLNNVLTERKPEKIVAGAFLDCIKSINSELKGLAEKPKLERVGDFKFVLLKGSLKFEARALLYKNINIKEKIETILKFAKDEKFELDIPDKEITNNSLILRLFSDKGYIEILVLPPRVMFNMYFRDMNYANAYELTRDFLTLITK